MVPVRTHPAIDPRLVGRAVEVAPGVATCVLDATPEMAADARGLVHGGFVFGLVDYAAMVAVNEPNVVLGEANVRFVAPVAVGQTVRATARVEAEAGRKRTVGVIAAVGEVVVAKGTLVAFVLDGHVLDAPAR